MKTSYFTKNNTLSQLVTVCKVQFHVYFNEKRTIIGVEPKWYEVEFDWEAETLLADVKVTEADIIGYFQDAHVYGHIIETPNCYEVQSWDRTWTSGAYQTLAEARMHLIHHIADSDDEDFYKASPFMEVLVQTPWGWIEQ
jgi:hypothetical protein